MIMKETIINQRIMLEDALSKLNQIMFNHNCISLDSWDHINEEWDIAEARKIIDDLILDLKAEPTTQKILAG